MTNFLCLRPMVPSNSQHPAILPFFIEVIPSYKHNLIQPSQKSHKGNTSIVNILQMRKSRLKKLSTLPRVIYLGRGGASILILTKACLSRGPCEWLSVVRRKSSLVIVDGEGFFMFTFELPKTGHKSAAFAIDSWGPPQSQGCSSSHKWPPSVCFLIHMRNT